MEIPQITYELKWHFTLVDKTNGVTYDQDRHNLSFAEFIADRAEGCDEIDWDNCVITRIENGTGAKFTLTPAELDDDIEKAKQILYDREWSAKIGRDNLCARR